MSQAPDPDALYDQTARDFLGQAIGGRIVEITQHDKLEFAESGIAYVCLHLDSGITIRVQGDVTLDAPTGECVTIGLPRDEADDETDDVAE